VKWCIIILVLFCAVATGPAAGEYSGFTVQPGDPHPVSDGDATPVTPVPADVFRQIPVLYAETARVLPPAEAELLGLGIMLLFSGVCALIFRGKEKPYTFNPTSRKIYEFVRDHPGVTTARIAAELGVSRGSVRHNLLQLVKHNRLQVKKLGRKDVYFPSGPQDVMFARTGIIRHIMAQKNQQEIFRTILDNPNITQKELIATTGIPRTTLQWHVSKLRQYHAVATEKNVNSVHYTIPLDFAENFRHYQDIRRQAE
jgi:predicted transcriptional regulator